MHVDSEAVCSSGTFHKDACDEKALDLSESFWNDVALPSLQTAFPEDWMRMGAGLVGNGSDCFGYDDEISRDHDWGVEFLLWLEKSDYERLAERLGAWKQHLREENPTVPFRMISAYGLRESILTPDRFYASLIGFPQGPRSITDWRRVPEANLALAVNGRIFTDPVGRFSATRQHVLDYYPEDLRRKKIAARCLEIAQTGQYNFLRCAQRKDTVAKEISLSKFAQSAISMTFLLNRRFMPYYKWSFHAMCELPVLADEIAGDLERLWSGEVVNGDLDAGTVLLRPISALDKGRAVLVEQICGHIVDELRHQGLSDSDDTFLVAHGERVQSLIQDPDLARIPTQYE